VNFAAIDRENRSLTPHLHLSRQGCVAGDHASAKEEGQRDQTDLSVWSAVKSSLKWRFPRPAKHFRGSAQMLPETPFVLLDDARSAGAAPARLYAQPVETVVAQHQRDVAGALARIKATPGDWAGFLSYEVGQALEPKLAKQTSQPDLPLIWFARFAGYEEIAPEDVAARLPNPASGWLGTPAPRLPQTQYAEALGRVKEYIAAGDIYQANLSLRADVATLGHPLALYAGLRSRAQAGYGGIVWTGEDWLLSLSPELFFALQSGKVTTKPMKGTAARGADDAAIIEELCSNPKQRAENLMIVDLLRNDLSRVATPGSVAVPHLFTVETYPTLHAMTSTVTAQLAEGLDAVDIISAIFPCGSITGAPKIRAMEIIDEIEQTPRGAYTGSIGRLDANGDAAFNVAIRTLHLPMGESRATLGLGGGIVADSMMADEWLECRAKGEFVQDRRVFDLIETMRFDPDSGIALLERHLARLKDSAAALGFVFDRHAARNELQAATFRLHDPRRVRLLLARSGQVAVEISPPRPVPASPVEIALVALPVDPDDFRLRHKISDRAFYETARAQAGTFEVALVDPSGFITEGSFTTIFVERGGTLLTPPLSRGLLPGVLRAELIDSGRAVEADLRAEDLVDGLFIGNASRGLIPGWIPQGGLFQGK
jgi:para-aminobenzoate synthetase / 4-amino-4-deoxychorismate lyase